MMRKEATLHDVARRVGVSTRTVSRVVNDEGGFSEDTRTRVLAVVDELGYRPNLLARGLITRRSGTIGLVGGDLTDPFFPEVADGVQRAARDVGLTMFFASTDNEPDRQRSVLHSLQSHAADGVIVFPAPGSHDHLIATAAGGLPVVVVDEHLQAPNLVSVASDISGGAAVAVRHLQQQGRRNIAMITAADKRRWRESAYRATLRPDATPLVQHAEPTWAGGMRAMQELLASSSNIDGVFAYNDLMALGAIRVLTAAGLHVPTDVSVVGFDNIDVSAVVTPSLTTINLDRERIGREAVAHLVALRDTAESTPPTIVPVELIQRESS